MIEVGKRIDFKFVTLQQGSREWLQWRDGGIGASDAGAIIADYRGTPELWPWGNAETILREKVYAERREQNFAMRRGNRLEPVARELFTQRTGIPVKPVCVESTAPGYSWMRASLDGWRWKGSVILEIKAPCLKDHEWAIEKLVPPKYRPQLTHQCLTTSADEVYYASYSVHESVPEVHQLEIVRYVPSAEELGELLEAEEKFWAKVQQLKQSR